MFNSPNEKHVYYAYKRFIEKHGYCPRLEDVQRDIDLSIPTIRGHRENLVQKNLLEHLIGSKRATKMGKVSWKE